MQFVADLHLHSKYSRAVSRDMVLPIMADYAKRKGLDILTASDFTHTLWFKEIRHQLEEESDGLYRLKSQISNIKSQINTNNQNSKDTKDILFLLSVEIASIYSEKGKLRRIHNLVFAPNFETAEKINRELINRGCNLSSDGRPIVGISSKNLLSMILEIDERCMLVPCHVWTPHFGLYGSASGYDSIEESFENLSRFIYGIETGLSSDPDMNWQVKELMDRSILSFSDAHSPAKMGREATVFELAEPTYENIRKAIMRVQKTQNTQIVRQSEISDSQKNRNSEFSGNRILYTIEFYPEEGKYHFSGHRNCKVVRDPKQTRAEGNICPVCKRRLTEGVLYRVEQLADEYLLQRSREKLSKNGIKWYTDSLKKQPPYIKLVPLLEIAAQAMESTVSSQKVKDMFAGLCNELGSEIDILLHSSITDIARIGGEKIADGVAKVRSGDIVIDPGYDGEYGHVKIWPKGEIEKVEGVEKVEDKKEQMGLF